MPGRKPAATEKTESIFTFQPIQPDKSNEAEEKADYKSPEPVNVSQPYHIKEPVNITQPDPIKGPVNVSQPDPINEPLNVSELDPIRDDCKSASNKTIPVKQDEIGETKEGKNIKEKAKGTTEGETAFNFKPISPAANQPANLADENEDSFFPTLE